MNVQSSVTSPSIIMDMLDEVMINTILPSLNFDEIQTFGRVNKKFNILTSTKIPALLKLKFYQDKTVNPEDWAELAKKCSLLKVEWYRVNAMKPEKWKELAEKCKKDRPQAFIALPENVVEIFKGPCPIDGNKKFGDTHVIVWVPEGINMEICASFFKQKSKKDPWFHVSHSRSTQIGQWIVMPRSDYVKTFSIQKTMPAKLEKRELISATIPTSLEAIICLVGAFVKFNIKIFENHYARCADETRDFIVDEETARKYPGLERTPGQMETVGIMVAFNGENLVVASDRQKNCKIENAAAWKFSALK